MFGTNWSLVHSLSAEHVKSMHERVNVFIQPYIRYIEANSIMEMCLLMERISAQISHLSTINIDSSIYPYIVRRYAL